MKIKIAFVSMSVAVVVFASSAYATNWRLVKNLPDSKYFIDRSSVRVEGVGKKEGDKREVKILVSYETEQRNVKGARFFSMSFVDIFSCANRTRTTLSSIEYEGKTGTGRIVNSHKIGHPIPENIRAGSVDEHVMEMFVCDL